MQYQLVSPAIKMPLNGALITWLIEILLLVYLGPLVFSIVQNPAFY